MAAGVCLAIYNSCSPKQPDSKAIAGLSNTRGKEHSTMIHDKQHPVLSDPCRQKDETLTKPTHVCHCWSNHHKETSKARLSASLNKRPHTNNAAREPKRGDARSRRCCCRGVGKHELDIAQCCCLGEGGGRREDLPLLLEAEQERAGEGGCSRWSGF